QDPRLGRLDAGARPLVAVVIDSARAADLPTEPLVQRALEGATKGAPGSLIVSAVQRLAADLGRARAALGAGATPPELEAGAAALRAGAGTPDRKSTRLNSSHLVISYAVFCLKKK